MILGIDHLVIAVTDPDAAADVLGADLGLSWTGGGRHEAMGTFNRLAFLGSTYLELIGVFDPSLVLGNASFAVGAAALTVLEAGRESLATYALATDDIDGEVVRLRAAGSSIGLPLAGSRLRPDGELVRWLAAFPALGPDRPPFMIQHDHRDAEWNDSARAERAGFRHPVGGRVRLAGLCLPVADPAAVAARYRETVGVAFDARHRATAGSRATGGGQAIELRAPAAGEDLVPLVDLTAEPGTPALDVVRCGIRWRRRADDPVRDASV